MIVETIVVGSLDVNCYIVASDKNSAAIIIDPGAEARKIQAALLKYNLTPGLIVNTHGHYDHIGCDDKFGVAVYAHKLDVEMLKNPDLNLSGAFALSYSVKSEIKELNEFQIIEAGGIALEVLHIPGHTRGGIALVVKKPAKEKVIFTGDSLFRFGIGRADLAGGNEALLLKSIKEKIFSLDDDVICYPGHGPATTIGEEKKYNPFFG